MSSARLPGHGGSTPFAAGRPPAAQHSVAAGLLLAQTLAPRTAHLVPCAGCGALNGRSALACWNCEAELLAPSPFAQTVVAPVAAPALASVEPIVERAAEPESEPLAPAIGATPFEGRQGLHLVTRESAAASVQAVPAAPAAAPEHTLDLPVLTALLDDTPLPPRRRKSWHLHGPVVGLAFAAITLLAAAAGLRWLVPPPVPAALPLADVLPAPPTSRADAALERPFAAPVQGGEPDRASLSFAPLEVTPAAPAADRPTRTAARSRPAPPRAVSPPARALPKPREIRETVSPPPAACTSNIAALGFCTLAPGPAKE